MQNKLANQQGFISKAMCLNWVVASGANDISPLMLVSKLHINFIIIGYRTECRQLFKMNTAAFCFSVQQTVTFNQTILSKFNRHLFGTLQFSGLRTEVNGLAQKNGNYCPFWMESWNQESVIESNYDSQRSTTLLSLQLWVQFNTNAADPY